MIKQLLKEFGARTNEQEFNEIMQIATDDIRENRIKFGKRTNLDQAMLIVFRAYVVMKRVVCFDVPWNLIDKKSPLPRAKKNL
ncbi:hypothetical protein KM792_13090 [Clostridium tyrobutyricum]|mgnify:FL=1|jgi:hypothetical protein|nr:hypothetical protein [Clostridium tyrobutyricum]MBV4423700.1 hypothetical protein [Clostridium tyrobutyricum]MBV4440134.1 hypothetical protein [Clostridium tyrobutyricum]MBV4450580.1 hypothetical protein [Clostridium tyrobutyricum]QCH27335.1 hypothetical protein EZN00_00930 [Clostridium tyrobutyricum]